MLFNRNRLLPNNSVSAAVSSSMAATASGTQTAGVLGVIVN